MRPLNSMGLGVQAQPRPPTQSGGVDDGTLIVTFDDPDTSEYILAFDDIDGNEYILTMEAA